MWGGLGGGRVSCNFHAITQPPPCGNIAQERTTQQPTATTQSAATTPTTTTKSATTKTTKKAKPDNTANSAKTATTKTPPTMTTKTPPKSIFNAVVGGAPPAVKDDGVVFPRLEDLPPVDDDDDEIVVGVGGLFLMWCSVYCCTPNTTPSTV